MEETALKQAILDSPHDDLPKLVFADWLDEQSRVVEAMSVRHYVLFGEINYGCYGHTDGGVEWGDGGGGTVDGFGSGDSGDGKGGAGAGGSCFGEAGGDGDGGHGSGDWGDGFG
jgi:uncharacterized protein (TIGR02996 family)